MAFEQTAEPSNAACVRGLRLRWLPGAYRLARLAPNEAIPKWALEGCDLVSITRTRDELSILAPDTSVPTDRTIRSEGPFDALTVIGPLDFSLVGVLSALAASLAGAGISLLAISTFDTDLLLVKSIDRSAAERALAASGFDVCHE